MWKIICIFGFKGVNVYEDTEDDEHNDPNLLLKTVNPERPTLIVIDTEEYDVMEILQNFAKVRVCRSDTWRQP